MPISPGLCNDVTGKSSVRLRTGLPLRKKPSHPKGDEPPPAQRKLLAGLLRNQIPWQLQIKAGREGRSQSLTTALHTHISFAEPCVSRFTHPQSILLCPFSQPQPMVTEVPVRDIPQRKCNPFNKPFSHFSNVTLVHTRVELCGTEENRHAANRV